MDTNPSLGALLAIALVAAVAPIVVGLFPRLHVPQVVVFLIGGVLTGPFVLGWAAPASIAPFVDLGLGFLFLLAGYELDFGALRAAPTGSRSWGGSSAWPWRSVWSASSPRRGSFGPSCPCPWR